MNELYNLLKYSLNFIIVLGLPCVVGVNAIALPIIDLLAGSEFYDSATALHILTITLSFSLLGGMVWEYDNASSRKRENVSIIMRYLCTGKHYT